MLDLRRARREIADTFLRQPSAPPPSPQRTKCVAQRLFVKEQWPFLRCAIRLADAYRHSMLRKGAGLARFCQHARGPSQSSGCGDNDAQRAGTTYSPGSEPALPASRVSARQRGLNELHVPPWTEAPREERRAASTEAVVVNSPRDAALPRCPALRQPVPSVVPSGTCEVLEYSLPPPSPSLLSTSRRWGASADSRRAAESATRRRNAYEAERHKLLHGSPPCSPAAASMRQWRQATRGGGRGGRGSLARSQHATNEGCSESIEAASVLAMEVRSRAHS